MAEMKPEVPEVKPEEEMICEDAGEQIEVKPKLEEEEEQGPESGVASDNDEAEAYKLYARILKKNDENAEDGNNDRNKNIVTSSYNPRIVRNGKIYEENEDGDDEDEYEENENIVTSSYNPKTRESNISLLNHFSFTFDEHTTTADSTLIKRKHLFKLASGDVDPEEIVARFETNDNLYLDICELGSEGYKRKCSEMHRERGCQGYTYFMEPVEWPKKVPIETETKTTNLNESTTIETALTATTPSSSCSTVTAASAKSVEFFDSPLPILPSENLWMKLPLPPKQQDPEIDYITWCHFVESENPAQRELAANALSRIVTTLADFKKNYANSEELPATNGYAKCTASDLVTHIENLMDEKDGILRSICQQLPECAKYMLILQAPYDEQFNYRVVPLLLQMLYNSEINLSRRQMAFDAMEQLLESGLIMTNVVQDLVIPGLFQYLRLTNELSYEQKGSFDLLCEGDNELYGRGDMPISLLIQQSTIVLRMLRNFMENGFQRYNILQCAITGRYTPGLSRDWMRNEFVPQFLDLFVESQKPLVLFLREFRELLAESLAPMAKWLDTLESDVFLLPVFQRFMRDNTEVQCAALKQLAEFCKVLSTDCRELLVSDLTLMVTVDAETRSWRQRAEFAEQLIHLVPLLPIDQVNKHLSAFALTFAADRICQVRNNGIALLAAVLGAFIREEWAQFYGAHENANDDSTATDGGNGNRSQSRSSLQEKSYRERNSISISSITTSGCSFTEREEQPKLSLADKLLSEIRSGFLRTRNWRRRQSFGSLLYQLVRRQLVGDVHFYVLFFHDLMNLSDDDVANVRQYFCLLAQLNQFEEYVGRSVHNRLEQMVVNDTDLEIRNLAKIALGKLNPDEEGLDLSGGRATGLLSGE